MAPVGVVDRRMDVAPVRDRHGIQARKETDADAADHSEVTPVGSAGQAEVWSDRQLRLALEILAGRRVEALSTWRADAIGTIPTITGGGFAPSGTASHFTSGLSRSRVESGVTSTPACSRGVNLQVSVEVERTRARPTAPGIAPALNANRFWPMASAPPTSRHSPSHKRSRRHLGGALQANSPVGMDLVVGVVAHGALGRTARFRQGTDGAFRPGAPRAREQVVEPTSELWPPEPSQQPKHDIAVKGRALMSPNRRMSSAVAPLRIRNETPSASMNGSKPLLMTASSIEAPITTTPRSEHRASRF